MDENLEIAIQTRQKFEFYFLALVFTVLGLSVETSVFSSKLQSVSEITAWAFFLISGLAGLSRMEWIPVSYNSYSDLTYEKSFAKEAKNGRAIVDESGRLQSRPEIDEWIQHAERRIKERTEKMGEIERRGKVKYFLHKWMFVIGIFFLVVSRAINLFSSQPALVT